MHVGNSLLDEAHLEDCRALLASGVRILLPTDTRALEPGGVVRPAVARAWGRGGA